METKYTYPYQPPEPKMWEEFQDNIKKEGKNVKWKLTELIVEYNEKKKENTDDNHSQAN